MLAGIYLGEIRRWEDARIAAQNRRVALPTLEELVHELRKSYAIVIVTHNLQQAARVADFTAFFYMGRLVEYNRTDVIFTGPRDPRTEGYITGRFG